MISWILRKKGEFHTQSESGDFKMLKDVLLQDVR